MDKTTAPGASGGQFVDDNPGSGVVGTLIIAADQNAHQDEVYNAIVAAGITPSSASVAQLSQAIKKITVERGLPLGMIYALPDRRPLVGWSVATVDTYFPGLCLTSIDSYTDISETNAPDAVPWLRGLKTIFKDGLTDEISSPVVIAWAIASNVATLTFQNNANHIAFLTALAEDNTHHGSYTGWRSVTLNTVIGTIDAGTYAITNVNASARTVSFAYTASDGGASGTWAADFYAYRVAGSTTTARVFSAKGLSLVGVNDINGYFVSGGLRRRGYFQGHWHDRPAGYDSFYGGKAGELNFTVGTLPLGNSAHSTSWPVNDGINGTPRYAKETHSPALSVHLYLHLGRYVA